MTRPKVFITLLLSLGLLLFPELGRALCLKNCNKIESSHSFSSNQFQDSNNRTGSHDFGDVKNSIIGDVHIRNGHERLEIKDMEANQSMIDASVNSTIILGDMKQK